MIQYCGSMPSKFSVVSLLVVKLSSCVYWSLDWMWLVAGSVWFQYFIEKLWKYLSTCHSQLWLSHLSHSGARTLLSEAGVDQILSPRTSTTSLLPAIINFPVLRLKSIKRKMIKEKILQFNDKRKILKSLLSSPKKYLVTFMLLSDF